MSQHKMKNHKKCLVIGAGLSGLVAAKELLDVGIEDITILERQEYLGGVWRSHVWQNATLTSSKWLTEFSSFPMPENYPDFLTPEQMVEYLESFATHFDLHQYIHYGVSVHSIEAQGNGQYDIQTHQRTYTGYDYVILTVGLHGKPRIPDIPGLDTFSGNVVHSSSYRTPEMFQGQRVLCIGLGESGVGISSEISSVTAETIVSASFFNPTYRLFPGTSIPTDLVECWRLGRYSRDYRDLVTAFLGYYAYLPSFLKSIFVKAHPYLRFFPREWLAKDWNPNKGHYIKLWHKPTYEGSDTSGNLTRPEATTDDIFHLVGIGQITPKPKVEKVVGDSVSFRDGSTTQVDAIVLNTGYEPGVSHITLPHHKTYQPRQLYKGCFDPQLPNIAFVGSVRPTIGSIPAMAEMQARWVAQIFSEQQSLPQPSQLQKRIEKDWARERKRRGPIQDVYPHIHVFEIWMDEMAQLIGCKPKLWEHLDSWVQLQAYFLGGTQPLRYRIRGMGAIPGYRERYAQRIQQIFTHPFAKWFRTHTIFFVLYPPALALALWFILVFLLHVSGLASVLLAALFWVAYITNNLFRGLFLVPFWAREVWMFSREKVFQRPRFTSSPQPTEPTEPTERDSLPQPNIS